MRFRWLSCSRVSGAGSSPEIVRHRDRVPLAVDDHRPAPGRTTKQGLALFYAHTDPSASMRQLWSAV
jgi:hypothetical protein